MGMLRGIALLAWNDRRRHAPDITFTRWLAAQGITGGISNPQWRAVWLALEREYRAIYQASEEPRVCFRCGGKTSKQGAQLCRTCWTTRGEWETEEQVA